jgi:crossover junction endodeoxyribonuclease RusA
MNEAKAVIDITLPWPPKELSPNARVHWATRARSVKRVRAHAYWTALAMARGVELPDGPIPVPLTFHPPDRHRRDWDNMFSSMKAGLDGIAQALEVDDNRFRPRLEVGDVVRGGVVIVTVGAA